MLRLLMDTVMHIIEILLEGVKNLIRLNDKFNSF